LATLACARSGVVWVDLRRTGRVVPPIADFDGLGIIAQLKHASDTDLSAETVGGRCE
jgi:hypothetical protein